MKESHNFDLSKTAKPDVVTRKKHGWFKPLAAAAAVLLVAATFAVLGPGGIFRESLDPNNPQQLMSLVSEAMAAQQDLIHSPGTVHMVVEEILPGLADSNLAKSRWLIQPSYRPDGSMQHNRVRLRAKVNQPYRVKREAWIDNDSGRYLNIVSFEGRVLFAHAFDGSRVFTFPGKESMDIDSYPITDEFNPPLNLAMLFGTAPSFGEASDSAMAAKNERMSITGEETLDNGERVRVLEIEGLPDPKGRVTGRHVRKVRVKDNTLAEYVHFIRDQITKITRYAPPEKVKLPDSRWPLNEVDPVPDNVRDQYGLSVELDVLRTDISQDEMLKTTDRPLCDLKSIPSWTNKKSITYSSDLLSGAKDFLIIFVADPGGKHVVINEAPHWDMLANTFKDKELLHESSSGFKLYSMGERSKWSANIAITATSYAHMDNPAEDRSAYLVESPNGSWCQLAINGALSDEELHSLADKLTLVGENK